MGATKRQLHLDLFIHSRGHQEASWRHPASSPLALTDIRYYQDLAQRAEAAKFDSIFIADQLALGEDVAQAPRIWLEPITTLAALAVATSRIGMIATASTTYTEPFNLAREFASRSHQQRARRLEHRHLVAGRSSAQFWRRRPGEPRRTL
jgi:alkanesulfonate monooxygenase SsuD/methylene tetrahydromethanopterin reductase-like flavin-dependent oxidoreductase (luciferase family)